MANPAGAPTGPADGPAVLLQTWDKGRLDLWTQLVLNHPGGFRVLASGSPAQALAHCHRDGASVVLAVIVARPTDSLAPVHELLTRVYTGPVILFLADPAVYCRQTSAHPKTIDEVAAMITKILDGLRQA